MSRKKLTAARFTWSWRRKGFVPDLRVAPPTLKTFDPSEARDNAGKWTSGGAGGRSDAAQHLLKPGGSSSPSAQPATPRQIEERRLKHGEIGLHPETKIAFGLREATDALKKTGNDIGEAMKVVYQGAEQLFDSGKYDLFWVDLNPATGTAEKTRHIVSAGKDRIRARSSKEPDQGLPMGGLSLMNGSSRIEAIPKEKSPLKKKSLKGFDSNEPRDDHGKWTGGGGSTATAAPASSAPAPASAPHGSAQHDQLLTAGTTAAKNVVSRVGAAVSRLIDRVPAVGHAKRALAKTLEGFRSRLAGRYGDKMAAVILASGATLDIGAHGAAAAMGIPLYIPGATIIGSIPALVLAEGCLQAKKLFGRGGAKKAVGGVDSDGGDTGGTDDAHERLSLLDIHAEARKLVKALRDEFAAWVKENKETLYAYDQT